MDINVKNALYCFGNYVALSWEHNRFDVYSNKGNDKRKEGWKEIKNKVKKRVGNGERERGEERKGKEKRGDETRIDERRGEKKTRDVEIKGKERRGEKKKC